VQAVEILNAQSASMKRIKSIARIEEEIMREKNK